MANTLQQCQIVAQRYRQGLVDRETAASQLMVLLADTDPFLSVLDFAVLFLAQTDRASEAETKLSTYESSRTSELVTARTAQRALSVANRKLLLIQALANAEG